MVLPACKNKLNPPAEKLMLMEPPDYVLWSTLIFN